MKISSENVKSAMRTYIPDKGIDSWGSEDKLDAQVSSLGDFGAGNGNVTRLHLVFKSELFFMLPEDSV